MTDASKLLEQIAGIIRGDNPEQEDNTCDVCGAACEETLHEFRCYPRMQRATNSLNVPRETG